MANVIFKTQLNNYVLEMWYKQRVFKAHGLISKFISNHLGNEFSEIFAEPQISESALDGNGYAYWSSDIISSNAKRLTELNQEDFLVYNAILEEKINKIKEFANKLLISEKNEELKWGQLILKAIKFPDLNHVFVENNKVVIVAWGFKLFEKSESEGDIGFGNSTPNNTPNLNNEDIEKENPASNENNNFVTNNEHNDLEELENKNNDSNHLSLSKSKEKEQTEKGIGNGNNLNRKWYKEWYFLILLILLLLILYFLLSNLFFDENNNLPPKEKVIVPVNPKDIIDTPDSLSKIAADRLNILLTGENKNIQKFAKQFKKVYPDTLYSIVYYDDETNRIQIKIPKEKRDSIKKELPTKMSDFQMLIWHESLFDHNFIPEDPGFRDETKSWFFKEIKAFDAWEVTKGDNNIVIAIIDGGFDLQHPEIKSKIVKPWDVLLHSSNIVSQGENSDHGTHVACLAAGSINNNEGLSGIAPNCKIMPIKVSDDNGVITTTAIIDGIMYAINHGADVVNMSLGMYFNPLLSNLPEDIQQEIIDNAYADEEEFWNRLFKLVDDKNIPFVLASGNQDILIGIDPMERSKYPIKVSAIDINEKKARFSNYGEKSDLSAPGVKIYSAISNNRFEFFDGTSMAAPIVAGGIALLKSIKPEISPKEIKSILQSTGKQPYSYDKHIGNIIQLSDALGFTKSGKIPEVDCNEIQHKIDSLNEIINKLKKKCGHETSVDTMIIPDNPEDLSFTMGRWKSTMPVADDKGKPVQLYFDFYDTGDGVLTLVTESNMNCTADLKLSLNNNELDINQIQNAQCSDHKHQFLKYRFKCIADNTGKAKCHAINKAITSNQFNFSLIRIK